MSLLKRLAGAFGIGQVTPYGDSGWSILRSSSVAEFERTGRVIRLRGWERNAVVNACVRVVVDIIGAVGFEVYRKVDDGEEILPTHPALDLLNNPRPGLSDYQLRGAKTAAPYVTYGNAFWLLERRSPRGLPVGIRPLHPERIEYVYTDPKTDRIVQWQWTDNSGTTHTSPAEDIIHFPDIGLDEDGYFGYPRAAAALLAVMADAEASQYVRQVVANSGSPTLAILTKGATQKDVQAAEKRWNERQIGRGERGNTRFLNDIESIQELGFNLTELEFPDLRRVSREDICAAFNVDPRIIGIASATSDSGLSGVQYREARFRLIQQTIMPIIKSIESVLNNWFMPEFGDVYVRFSPDQLAELTEDEGETSERIRAEVQAGLLTREEARVVLGRSETMDPNHTLIGSISRIEYPVAMQFTTIDAAASQGDDPNAPDGQEPSGNADGADDEPATANEGAEDRVGIGSLAHIRSRVIPRGVVLTDEQRLTLWQHMDRRATQEELLYERSSLMQFVRERDAVRAMFDDAIAKNGGDGRSVRADIDDEIMRMILRALGMDYAEGGTYHEEWVDAFLKLISHSFSVGGGDIAASIGVDFNMEDPRVIAAIRNRANKLASDVTATTYKQIQGLMETAISSGMPVRQTADLINDTVFDGNAPKRAKTIARTETIGSLNEGEYMAAIQDGIFLSKEWLAHVGAATPPRPTHIALDGVRIAISVAFSNGCLFPGDPNGSADEVINCRCGLLYYDEEAPVA